MSVTCSFEDDLENLSVMAFILGPVGKLATTNNILRTKFLSEGDDDFFLYETIISNN